jgi:diguanylate cyclase (GGDEF)-like protein/PAS domain S-box-containing protein
MNKAVVPILARQKILIVDDRKENLFALQQVLKGLDVDIVKASNGNDALTATLDHQFSLAILDVMMPGMDGYELATLLRSSDILTPIPIIFLSANKADEYGKYKSFEDCGIDYITKPFSPAILVTRVSQFLDLERFQNEVDHHEQDLQFLVDHLPVFIARVDVNKRYMFVNQSYANIHGYEPKDMTGQYVGDMVSATIFSQIEPLINRVLEGESFQVDIPISISRKDRHFYHINMSPSFDASEQAQGFLAAITDITARKKIEQALEDSNNSFREIVASSIDALIVLNIAGYVEYVNASAEMIFQRKAKFFIGDKFEFPIINSDFTEIEIFREGRAPGIGELHCVECLWKGKPAKLIMVTDVTERKQAEMQMIHLAHTDPLTGIANRTSLYEQFDYNLKLAYRSRKSMAVMMLDLDNFKLINDTYGHTVGDILLVQCAARIKNNIRNTDIAARFGGDEFTVVLTNLSSIESVRIVAEQIINSMKQPFIINEIECTITTSCGVAVFPKDGESIDILLANADAALLRGKSEGRNQFQFFDESIHKITMEARELDRDLRIAIKEKQFVLHFQPQFDANGVVGAEALIRWNHPTRGLLYPSTFLDELTKMDFKEVELWAITSGLKMAKTWQSTHGENFYVAVNLSAPTLQDTNLPAFVNEQIKLAGVSYKSLELEITEGILVQNVSETAKNLKLLSNMGVGIALDDFGVGYSSMVYLLNYPEINKLKIDCEFVWKMDENDRNLAILKSIIDLGHSLGMRIIAEGVESQKQFDTLSDYDCKNFQGYLVSPAIAAEDWKNKELNWQETIATARNTWLKGKLASVT